MAKKKVKKDNFWIWLGVGLIAFLFLLGANNSLVKEYTKEVFNSTNDLWITNNSLTGYLEKENITNYSILKDKKFYTLNKSFNVTTFGMLDIGNIILDSEYGYFFIEYKNLNFSEDVDPFTYINMGEDKVLQCDFFNTNMSKNIEHVLEWHANEIYINISGPWGSLETTGKGYIGIPDKDTSAVNYYLHYDNDSVANVSCYGWGSKHLRTHKYFDDEMVVECRIDGEVNAKTVGSYSFGRNYYIILFKNKSKFYGNLYYKVVKFGLTLWDILFKTNYTDTLDDYIVNDYLRNYNWNISLKDVYMHVQYWNTTNMTHVKIHVPSIFHTTNIYQPGKFYFFGIRQAELSGFPFNSTNMCDINEIMALRGTRTKLDYISKSD